MIYRSKPIQKISGNRVIPGDKSISHRAIILSSIAQGVTTIDNILLSEDVLATIEIMRALGVDIRVDAKKKSACVQGVGLHGLKASKTPLNCGNSGTSLRLLCGLLAAQPFNSVLIGDESLVRRPMLRVAEPLRLMGAKINLSSTDTAPIYITGGQPLKAIEYELKIPSAQVKSAILLASLYAKGETIVREAIRTRDHTERMLNVNNAHFIKVPGDISSAAFFIVAACITPHSDLIIRQVGVNPFRTGIIAILRLMGANIDINNHQFFGNEPVADIRIRYKPLQGISIPTELISTAIDEFPVLFIAAAIAHGNTTLRNASELRVKESDRIAVMCNGLKNLGVIIKEYDDGVLIEGDQTIQGGRVDSGGDHRVAMAFAVAGSIAKNTITIDNCGSVKTSFPDFVAFANQLGMKLCQESR